MTDDDVPREIWTKIGSYIVLDIDKHCWRLVCKMFRAILAQPPRRVKRLVSAGEIQRAALYSGTFAQIVDVVPWSSMITACYDLCTRGDTKLYRNYAAATYAHGGSLGMIRDDSDFVQMVPSTLEMASLIIELYGRMPIVRIHLTTADIDLYRAMYPLAGSYDYTMEFVHLIAYDTPDRIHDFHHKIDVLLPLVDPLQIRTWPYGGHDAHTLAKLVGVYRRRPHRIRQLCPAIRTIQFAKWYEAVVENNQIVREVLVNEMIELSPSVLEYVIEAAVLDPREFNWRVYIHRLRLRPFALFKKWLHPEVFARACIEVLFTLHTLSPAFLGAYPLDWKTLLAEGEKVRDTPPLSLWYVDARVCQQEWTIPLAKFYLARGLLPTKKYLDIDDGLSTDEARYYGLPSPSCIGLEQFLRLRIDGLPLRMAKPSIYYDDPSYRTLMPGSTDDPLDGVTSKLHRLSTEWSFF